MTDTQVTPPSVAQQWMGQTPTVKEFVIQKMLERRTEQQAWDARNPYNDASQPSPSDVPLGTRVSPYSTGTATKKSMLTSAFGAAIGSIVPTFLSGLLPGRERNTGDYAKNALIAAFGGAANNFANNGKTDWKDNLTAGALISGGMELLGGKEPGWKSAVMGVLAVPIFLGLSWAMKGMLDKAAERSNIPIPGVPAPAH